MTCAYLGGESPGPRSAVSGAWQQATDLAVSASHAPVHAPQLGTLLSSLAGDSLPGSTPVDRAFDQLSNAATSVQRGLEDVIAKRDVNWAGLGLHLGDLHESSLRYRDVRRALPLLTDAEVSWEVDLPRQSERLLALIEMLSEGRERTYRTQAQRSVSHFGELRAYAGAIVRKASEAAAQGEPWSDAPAKLEALEQWIDAAAGEFEGWSGFDTLIEVARLLGELFTGGPEEAKIHNYGTSGAMQDLWGDVAEVEPLDLELWLAARDRKRRMDELASKVADRLASSGVEARCAVFSAEPGEWLTKSATIAVIAKHTDLRDAEAIRGTVKSTIFSSTPEAITRIYLLINHEGDDVLPTAYCVWRISDHIENPYRALNPYAPWYPEPVDEALAEQLGSTVEQGQHPIAEWVSSMFGVQNVVHLTLSQFGALHATTSDPGWITNQDALKDVIERLQRRVAKLHTAVESLVQELSYGDVAWRLVGYGAIGALNKYFEWLLAVARNDVDSQDLADALEDLNQAIFRVENKLYFDRAPDTDVSQDGPSGAYERYLELHEAVEELLREASAELA